MRVVDARDPSTAMHSEVVSSLAEAIGIELGADPRIVLVADAFEAMTADRPYRGRRALERHLAGSRDQRVEALA